MRIVINIEWREGVEPTGPEKDRLVRYVKDNITKAVNSALFDVIEVQNWPMECETDKEAK